MATDTIETITLADFNNSKPLTYLWLCGVGMPAGQDFAHNTDAEDEDYCDLGQLIGEVTSVNTDGEPQTLWNLTGRVVNGQWEWDGNGNIRDQRGNTVYNVKAH